MATATKPSGRGGTCHNLALAGKSADTRPAMVDEPERPQKSASETERAERLARALRENLKRRKAQARERDEAFRRAERPLKK